jgi:hypothetical protein
MEASVFKSINALVLGLTLSTVAVAQDDLPAPPPEDALPVPTLDIDRIPPRSSYEFAVQFSYGTVTYWRDYVPPWIGFGLRGGWGRNLGVSGAHRLGPSLTVVAEGPVGVHTSVAVEPHLAWDFVGDKGLLLGAGVGPALMVHSRSDTVGGETAFGVAPGAAVRLGWSQTFSRVGRRLFVFLEPKIRYVDGAPNPLVAIAIGSGRGK